MMYSYDKVRENVLYMVRGLNLESKKEIKKRIQSEFTIVEEYMNVMKNDDEQICTEKEFDTSAVYQYNQEESKQNKCI